MLVFMLYYTDGTRTIKQRKYVRQLNRTLDRQVCSHSLVTVLPTISWFLMYQTNIQYMLAGYFLSESELRISLFI